MATNARPPEHDTASQDEYGLLMDMLRVSVSKHKLDEDFTLVWANPHYYEFIGYPKDEYEALYHNSPRAYFADNPEDLANIAEHVGAALENGDSGYECLARMHVKGDRILWVKFTATFLDEYVDGYQLSYTTMTDITELMEAHNRLEQANEELEKLAFVDPVTGGFNQTRFDLTARQAIDEAEPGTYALVAIDIKKFKLLNEIQGADCGDRVLRYVLHRLQAHLHEGEYAGRIAADAFNMLLRLEDDQTVDARVDALVQDINKYNDGAERPYFFAFTVGVYPVDDPSLSMTIIRDRANVARNAGRDAASARHFTCVFYSEVDRKNLLNEQDMENRMHAALERGEFVAYLQPKLRLSDGAIGGAEALVRWVDPERGLVPPGDFVPFFERNGFIVDVDLNVFEQVCALVASWMERGIEPVPISVNMSRAHLRSPDFLAPYERIRARHGVPECYLEFEITETLVFGDPELFAGVIDELHARGYRCSLDDFGSGYSSLNLLKDIDIDVMKLDRAFFLAGADTERREWNVIESVIDLAKRLEVETVAEGVEEPSQVDRLRAMACDLVQGYVFSRPVPVAEFERMLAEQ